MCNVASSEREIEFFSECCIELESISNGILVVWSRGYRGHCLARQVIPITARSERPSCLCQFWQLLWRQRWYMAKEFSDTLWDPNVKRKKKNTKIRIMITLYIPCEKVPIRIVILLRRALCYWFRLLLLRCCTIDFVVRANILWIVLLVILVLPYEWSGKQNSARCPLHCRGEHSLLYDKFVSKSIGPVNLGKEVLKGCVSVKIPAFRNATYIERVDHWLTDTKDAPYIEKG